MSVRSNWFIVLSPLFPYFCLVLSIMEWVIEVSIIVEMSVSPFNSVSFCVMFLVLFFERERESEHELAKGRGRGRSRKRILNRFHAQSRA